MKTMSGFIVERCRSCDAPVIWARTALGQSIPIDAEPAATGNVRLFQVQGFARAKIYRAVELPSVRLTGTELRTSHFATCPHAKQWRKER